MCRQAPPAIRRRQDPWGALVISVRQHPESLPDDHHPLVRGCEVVGVCVIANRTRASPETLLGCTRLTCSLFTQRYSDLRRSPLITLIAHCRFTMYGVRHFSRIAALRPSVAPLPSKPLLLRAWVPGRFILPCVHMHAACGEVKALLGGVEPCLGMPRPRGAAHLRVPYRVPT